MKRRSFLQSTLAAGAGACLTPTAAQADASRPNLLVILVDDMGFSDLGCYGGEVNTPVLDGLADHGIRFTQFYNTARCCPTRASILTGQYPHQAGVGHMVSDEGFAGYRGHINRRSVTLAEALKPAGYSTYHAGKWHVGEEKGHWPLDRGFDRYFGLINGASNFYNDIDYRDPDQRKTFLLDDQRFDVPATSEEQWTRNEGFYTTDAFTDFALTFLQEHDASHPFLLYLAYTAPHWPLHAFPEDRDRYRGRFDAGWEALREQRFERQKALGLFDDTVRPAPFDRDRVPRWSDVSQAVRDEFVLEMELYAAMIDRMDRNIGRVVSHLRRTGQLDNTLILFVSDNGGCHTTPSFSHLQGTPGGPNSFPCYGYMGAEVSNTPFRKWKQFIHEGGIASPCIAHFPRRLGTQGRLETQPGHVIDVMPTAMQIAGADYPAEHGGHAIQPMRGVSLMPALQGGTLMREEPLYWEHVRNKGIRQGDWKLVAAKPDLEWELYNLAEDRTEQRNMAERDPRRVASMASLYEDWARLSGVKPYHQG